METLNFKFHLNDDISPTGEFVGYAAVFGNKDLGGDVIKQGAFKRTLDATGGRVPILWQHDQTNPIGVGVEAEEDGKGLRVKAQLNQEVRQGVEARSLMQQGALKGLSIGFALTQDGFHFEKDTRFLTEIKLHEYSPVTFPMNTRAQVEAVKSDTPMQELLRQVIAKAAGLNDDSQELQLLIQQTKSVLNTLDATGPQQHPDAPSQPVSADVLAELKQMFELIKLERSMKGSIYND